MERCVTKTVDVDLYLYDVEDDMLIDELRDRGIEVIRQDMRKEAEAAFEAARIGDPSLAIKFVVDYLGRIM